MKAIATIFWKELIDALRDRRTVMVALFMGPLLSPLLMIGLQSLTISKELNKAEKRLELPVVGAEHAPNLVAWLKQQNLEIKDAPADPEEAVRKQESDLVLRIGADYAENWRASRPAQVEMIFDSTRQDNETYVRRVQRLLENYGSQVGALRLIARGVHPSVNSPVSIADRDVATPESKSNFLLSIILPYFLILMGFLGGMHLAIDSTAGERERQSLEPLLATPVSRGAIMSGKLAAACTFALVSLALTLIAFKLSFALMPSERIGIAMDLNISTMIKIFLVLVPTVMFGSVLLTFLAAFAKSYREAQSYLSILMLLPMIPTLILMVSPVKSQLWMLAIPFLAPNQMIVKLVRGEVITGPEMAMVLGAGLALAGLLWLIAARAYKREQLAISA
jgi:sodium transport system permease protein